MIEVTVNGRSLRFAQPVQLSAVLQELDAAGKKVAVERNGEIVPRSLHAQTVVQNGDKLEVVVAVGGG